MQFDIGRLATCLYGGQSNAQGNGAACVRDRSMTAGFVRAATVGGMCAGYTREALGSRIESNLTNLNHSGRLGPAADRAVRCKAVKHSGAVAFPTRYAGTRHTSELQTLQRVISLDCKTNAHPGGSAEGLWRRRWAALCARSQRHWAGATTVQFPGNTPRIASIGMP